MQVVKSILKQEIGNLTNQDFIPELAESYLEAEILKKKEILHGYIEAYSDIDDKDSFNAEYLLVLIEMLKAEIEDETKSINSFLRKKREGD